MKKKIKTALILLVAGLMLTACAGAGDTSSEEETKTEVQEEKQVNTENKKNESDFETEKNGDEKDSEAETESRTVKIYQPDDNGMEIIFVEKEVKDEQDIWQELINASILDENCEIIDFQVNESDKTIDLNFNKAVGDRIRSMGTTGEAEIIGCLTNTYLDAYDCEKIRLLEEGENLTTGHGAATEGYRGWYEF